MNQPPPPPRRGAPQRTLVEWFPSREGLGGGPAEISQLFAREKATRIVEQLQRAGFEAFWVGGCVRDFMLGRAKPITAERDPVTGSIHFYGHERIGADMAVDIMTRLRFPKQQIEDVATAVRYHMQFKDAPKMRKATLRRMLLRTTFPLELALHRLDCLGSHRRLEVYEFMQSEQAALSQQPQIIPPFVTGADLLALGLKSGPEFGAILSEARDLQLGEEIGSREEALDWLRKRIAERRG